MYVYTGTKMKDWPYRRKLVPSIGHRFPEQMGTDVQSPELNQTPTTMPVNLVRAALLVAAGAVAWKMYESMRDRRLTANLPSFPGIGPLFNVGSTIGSAYNLGPWII
ncbi:MAG: hypothetical protein ACYSWO_19785 [Planctomycetota bacterium]|jgi:hypothetical protein